MDCNGAIDVLHALAEGKHPETKKAILDCAVLQIPSVVTALNMGVLALRADSRRQNKRQKHESIPEHTGKLWTEDEDAQLKKSGVFFDSWGYNIPKAEFSQDKATMKQIASNHGRTLGAITARLVRHGIIPIDLNNSLDVWGSVTSTRTNNKRTFCSDLNTPSQGWELRGIYNLFSFLNARMLCEFLLVVLNIYKKTCKLIRTGSSCPMSLQRTKLDGLNRTKMRSPASYPSFTPEGSKYVWNWNTRCTPF